MLDWGEAAPGGKFVNLSVEETFFGPGCVGDLAKVLARDGIERAVLVTGRSLARNEALLGKLLAALDGRCAGIFSETVPHVPRATAIAAARFARSRDADALISFGGSTQSDTAKAVVWALAEAIDRPEQFEPFAIRFEYPDRRVVPPMGGRAIPIYAVPTTLSAGEFTSIAGITDPVGRHKQLFQDRKLVAKAVFLDPGMTVATPEWLWLASGIKAIDHCVEAWLSIRAQPFTDALAGHALAKLFKFLPICRRESENLAARVECQIAAWLSVAGLSNVSLGLSHGIGHQIGSVSGVSHGHTSCVVLQHVIGFNRAASLARQAALGDLVGEPGAGDDHARAAALQDAVLRLVRDELGLPWRLRDVGVSLDDLPAIAQAAMRDALVATNPRPIRSESEIADLLRQAW